MTERRKLNDVFTKPCTYGIITICGIIGSGKTREEVVLQKRAPIKGGDVVKWRHRRGEQWSKLKELVEDK